MSCYEWENGTIKIPSKDWVGLKKSVRDAWNDLQERSYSVAIAVWEDIKNGASWKEAIRKRKPKDSGRTRYGSHSMPALPVEMEWRIKDSIYRGENRSVCKPRKKDFSTKTNRDTCFGRGDWSIQFDNKRKAVTWDVMENNRARDHARRDPVAQALFKALNSIRWTRGSGGKIVGNDEYNRESIWEGGGGNYVCSRYGPKGERSVTW